MKMKHEINTDAAAGAAASAAASRETTVKTVVKPGAAAEAAAPAAAASVLISCFIFIFYFGFSFDLILIFAFFFANTSIGFSWPPSIVWFDRFDIPKTSKNSQRLGVKLPVFAKKKGKSQNQIK